MSSRSLRWCIPGCALRGPPSQKARVSKLLCFRFCEVTTPGATEYVHRHIHMLTDIFICSPTYSYVHRHIHMFTGFLISEDQDFGQEPEKTRPGGHYCTDDDAYDCKYPFRRHLLDFHYVGIPGVFPDVLDHPYAMVLVGVSFSGSADDLVIARLQSPASLAAFVFVDLKIHGILPVSCVCRG